MRCWASSLPWSQVSDRRKEWGTCAELVDNGILDFSSCMSIGQVKQQRVPGRAFHERADRGLSLSSDNQVTFPMSGTALSSTLAGRSLIITMGSLNRGRT